MGLSAVFQAVWAWVAIDRPGRRMLVVGAAVNAVFVGVWVWSRTLGLPIGPEAGIREPIGLADGLTVAFEVAVVTLCVGLLRSNGVEVDDRDPGATTAGSAGRRIAGGLAAAALVTATLIGIRAAEAHGGAGLAAGHHDDGTTHSIPSGPAVSGARAEALTGLAIEHVTLVASGGMIDVRYRVLDAVTARNLLGGHELAIVDRARDQELSEPWMGHAHDTMDDGDRPYLLLLNLGGAVQTGQRVLVRVGDVLVGPIVVG
jgi:hypothetical protein